jgi:hypothetical protein
VNDFYLTLKEDMEVVFMDKDALAIEISFIDKDGNQDTLIGIYSEVEVSVFDGANEYGETTTISPTVLTSISNKAKIGNKSKFFINGKSYVRRYIAEENINEIRIYLRRLND